MIGVVSSTYDRKIKVLCVQTTYTCSAEARTKASKFHSEAVQLDGCGAGQ